MKRTKRCKKTSSGFNNAVTNWTPFDTYNPEGFLDVFLLKALPLAVKYVFVVCSTFINFHSIFLIEPYGARLLKMMQEN